MAHFHRHPGGQRISGQQVTVDGDALTVGLWGYTDDSGQELALTNGGTDLVLDRGAVSGGSRLWNVRVSAHAKATKDTVSDTVYANTTQDGVIQFNTWDQFRVTFRFKKGHAASLIVRPVTAEVLGGPPALWRSANTEGRYVINRASYDPTQPAGLLDFSAAPGKQVHVAVFAAKLGAVERAFVLMKPPGGAKNLLIVLSHTFGQNNAYYSNLGYANPLSPPLIQEVVQKFVLGRWGQQLMAAKSDYALLMPVRAQAGGASELGPFVDHTGVGAQIVHAIRAMADGAFGLDRVALVTFSNGVWAGNQFLGAGAKGLTVHWGVNQDPAGGTPLSASLPGKKQYLSGFTTGHRTRPGFEFLPMARWVKEPNYGKMFPGDPFNYMHTWCIPHYTLFLGMG